MITGINESKTLTTYISCECKYRFKRKKCNLNQWWNNDKCRCECKKCHIYEKEYIWNTATCNCENAMYNSAIMHDEVRN